MVDVKNVQAKYSNKTIHLFYLSFRNLLFQQKGKKMKKKIALIGLAFGLSTVLMAKPNANPGQIEMFHAIIKKAAGPVGHFVKKEQFPKDYFLIPRNLPFMVGLTMMHPQSSTLNLSQEQLQQIKTIRDNTVPSVLKAAKKIKDLELQLVQEIGLTYKSKPSKAYHELVEKIGKMKVELTKAHLLCIEQVKAVLSEEQFKKVLEYTKKHEKKDK
jgi:hypothetical protein